MKNSRGETPDPGRRSRSTTAPTSGGRKGGGGAAPRRAGWSEDMTIRYRGGRVAQPQAQVEEIRRSVCASGSCWWVVYTRSDPRDRWMAWVEPEMSERVLDALDQKALEHFQVEPQHTVIVAADPKT